MTAGRAAVVYVGGPLCGAKGSADLLPSGLAPFLIHDRYEHSGRCSDRGQGEAHVYDWRPMHPVGHRPRRRGKECCPKVHSGCPMYVPPKKAT